MERVLDLMGKKDSYAESDNILDTNLFSLSHTTTRENQFLNQKMRKFFRKGHVER